MIPTFRRGSWGAMALVATLAVSSLASAQQIEARDDEGRIRLRGFADFTTTATSQRGVPWAFGLGQFDLYMTSKLSDRISFLGETVFEFDDGFIVDVERVIVTFAARSYFRVAVGKHHTPIGYWNNAFHHGTLLQPTINRPQLVRFEDEGGVLPIHTTGVLVSGRDISPLHLGYDVMVGNGIGSTPTGDDNTAKSYTMALHSQVTSALSVGASMYTDRIAAGSPSLGGSPVPEDVTVQLFGGFATYLGRQLELISEFQRSEHRSNLSGTNAATNALYVYGGYRFGSLVPYVRYDDLQFPTLDPYFVSDNFRQALLGARYDLGTGAVLKAEIARRKTSAAGRVTLLTLQAAVGF